MPPLPYFASHLAMGWQPVSWLDFHQPYPNQTGVPQSQSSPVTQLLNTEPCHKTCVADCRAEWAFDDETRTMVWNLFLNGPEPVGYDPSIIPAWENPTVDAFAVLRLEPWHLRVFPGSVLMGQGGEVLNWVEEG